MATGTITLRPSQDIDVEHSTSRGSNAYSMIADTVADDDSTYIYSTLSSGNWGGSNVTDESTFILSGSIPQGNIHVTEVRMYSRARIGNNDESGSYTCYFAVGGNGGDSSDAATNANLTSSYQTHTSTSDSLVQEINDALSSGSFPQMSVRVHTNGSAASGMKAEDGYIRVTQVYMEIDYEEVEESSHIYIKENGRWVEYSKVFIKRNNAWVEQDNPSDVFGTDINYVKQGEV